MGSSAVCKNQFFYVILFGCFFYLLSAGLSLAEDSRFPNEERLDHGLTNNDAYSFLLMEESGAASERKALLEQARMHSPDLPAPYFKIASDRLGLSLKGVFESLNYIRMGIRAYERNFLWRSNLWGLLTKGILYSFLLTVLLMMVIRFPSQTGLMMHEIKEDRKKVFLLFLPIVFSIFGILPLLVSLLSLYGLYLKERQRAVIYFSFLVLLFLSLSPGIFRIFSIPSHLKAAVLVNEGRDNKYGLLRLKGMRDLPSSFAYALALKREGYYRESIDIYKGLSERYRLAEIYVNLGNSLYASGDPDGAIEYYNKSLSIRPLAAAYFNLSQVYREKLDFKRGEEYFEEAARLDSESLRQYTLLSGKNPNRFVVDVRLPDSYIWDQMISERGGLIRVTSIFLVTLGAVSSFFILDRILKNRARRCRRCGSIYCSKCSRMVTWRDMCSSCYRSLIRMDQMYSRERVANLLLMYEDRARRRMIARLLSSIIPGAGQVYSGRVIEGFLLSWFFIFALISLILSRVMTEGIYPFHHSWLVFPLIFVIILLYGISIVHIRRGVQRGWL